MFVDGIHNIPVVAIIGVGVTKAVCHHYIVCGSTSKLMKGTCKAEIWGNWSIWYVALSLFPPRCSHDVLTTKGGETFECRTVFHSICQAEVDFSKFVLNVLN